MNSKRGAKPGERRGGRQKGSLNKVNRDLKELARAYTPEALNTLAEIMRDGESESARVVAANSLLDRGHGKPGQHIAVDQNVTVKDEREVIDGIADIFGLSVAARASDAPGGGGTVVRSAVNGSKGSRTLN